MSSDEMEAAMGRTLGWELVEQGTGPTLPFAGVSAGTVPYLLTSQAMLRR